MSRRDQLLVAFGIAAALVAAAPSRLPGDGGEYLALALNFANLRGPSIAPGDMPSLMSELGAYEPGLEQFDPRPFMRQASDGSLDFLHFWFYSLLATPFVWLTQLVDAPPTYAFALLNVTLLLSALAVTLPRLGTTASMLLFASPILWWINKAHTEPFSFAMLAIAFTLLRERPWLSLVAAGAAAAQTPPMLVFLGIVGVASLAIGGWAIVKDRRWQIGVAVAAALAAIQPIYFLSRYGTPYLLVDTTQPGQPPLAEVAAPLVDPNIGLIPNFPAWAIVVVAAVVVVARRRARELATPEVIAAAIAGMAFLTIVARNTNPHHGGTPSISRYALWLIPLAIPLLLAAARLSGRGWRTTMGVMAFASALVCVFAFHPAVPQNSREPTWLSTWLWTKHPRWYNPLPQIFIETHTRGEEPHVPITTPGCEKLLIGGGKTTGVWPIPCYPQPIPDECRGRYCYANLSGHDYLFVPPPGRDQGPGYLQADLAWPAEAEAHVRDLYRQWDWHSLVVHGSDRGWLRQARGVRVNTLAGPDRMLYVLRFLKPGAAMFFRPPGAVAGILFDPRTGQAIRDLEFRGAPGERWDVEIPADTEPLILALKEVR